MQGQQLAVVGGALLINRALLWSMALSRIVLQLKPLWFRAERNHNPWAYSKWAWLLVIYFFRSTGSKILVGVE